MINKQQHLGAKGVFLLSAGFLTLFVIIALFDLGAMGSTYFGKKNSCGKASN
ncbi:MAG: hypothetical protein ACWIPH_04855 [Ostreibacterium sp.]